MSGFRISWGANWNRKPISSLRHRKVKTCPSIPFFDVYFDIGFGGQPDTIEQRVTDPTPENGTGAYLLLGAAAGFGRILFGRMKRRMARAGESEPGRRQPSGVVRGWLAGKKGTGLAGLRAACVQSSIRPGTESNSCRHRATRCEFVRSRHVRATPPVPARTFPWCRYRIRNR